MKTQGPAIASLKTMQTQVSLKATATMFTVGSLVSNPGPQIQSTRLSCYDGYGQGSYMGDALGGGFWGSAGTFGSAGSFGGCAGSVGTAGTYGSGGDEAMAARLRAPGMRARVMGGCYGSVRG